GRIVEVGTPLELYLHPKRLFTANFVGEANLMIGKVVEEKNDGVKVKIGDAVLQSSERVDFKGKKVVAAIRPEFVVMDKLR
ncbi:MAG: ABC transporter ATP-binding protein, partial [Nitrososphaeria archaeon]|nr:ABC transporter ATP-binding protein [Nitrososphaeria archaeon]